MSRKETEARSDGFQESTYREVTSGVTLVDLSSDELRTVRGEGPARETEIEPPEAAAPQQQTKKRYYRKRNED